jgi:hypothetical protein
MHAHAHAQMFLFNDILLFTRAGYGYGGKFKFELYVDLSSAVKRGPTVRRNVPLSVAACCDVLQQRVFEIESEADFELSDRLRSWVHTHMHARTHARTHTH